MGDETRPRRYPVGDSYIGASLVESTPTDTDLLLVYDVTDTNDEKAISLANLFLNAPPFAGDSVKLTATVYTATGAIDPTKSLVHLDTASGKIEMTIAAPVAGHFMVITQVDTGTDGHTVTLTAGDYDGTNDIATFNAAEETLVLFGLSATRYVIVENIGSVALSAS